MEYIPGNGSGSALIVFLLYTLVVFALAWFSHKVLEKKAFMGEYFLGSRSLGMLALALTFGATSASAGSFAGFPALIYAHGWVLALWIASYMIFPLCGMGLLGKRLNQVARRSGAITVPDVLRDRFDSRGLALLSTTLMAALLTVYLIPQFKLAALIMEELLGRAALYQRAALGLAVMAGDLMPVGVSPEYLLGLLLFAVLVVLYTTFGGFRAVVWTDMLQGFVMVIGVLVMLVLALVQVGGLKTASERLQEMTPPRLGQVQFEVAEGAGQEGRYVASDTWFSIPGNAGEERILRINQAVFIPAGVRVSESVPVVEITTPQEKAAIRRQWETGTASLLSSQLTPRIVAMKDYVSGAGQPGVYVRPPGPSATDAEGFLPLGLAFSFFVFWALSGTGQPGNMVRLMAFDSARTLKRSIAALAVYFTLIYVPLVIIFVCARILVPGLDQTPDRIMPVMAFTLTGAAGIPWMAGLLIAAPFAAAMSTVDSFMLMISSSVVRDVYQRNVNPDAPERTIKRMSYACTLFIGVLATLGAIRPPQFMQYLIVFTGGGLSVAFLAPVALGLYWPRFNREGAYASMLGGTLSYLLLYLAGFLLYGRAAPLILLGLDPLIWGFFVSLLCAVVVTYLTPPPPVKLVREYFYK